MNTYMNTVHCMNTSLIRVNVQPCVCANVQPIKESKTESGRNLLGRTALKAVGTGPVVPSGFSPLHICLVLYPCKDLETNGLQNYVVFLYE